MPGVVFSLTDPSQEPLPTIDAPRPRRVRALVVAPVLILTVTAGCSSKSKDAEPAPTAVTTSTTALATTTTALANAVPTTLLAGVEGDIPGIRLELNSLQRRSDDVVRLNFTLVNTGTEPFTIGDNFGALGTVDGIYIEDTANEQQLGALTEGAGVCRCSQGMGVLEPGQQLSLFVELAGPPADVGVVSVVVPHFPGVQRIRMSAG